MSNPFDPGYYRADELRSMGFARIGEGTAIARNCTIIGLENITIGDFVRIDGYTTIIAPEHPVRIANRVHICSGCVLGGRAGIDISDYASLSHGVKLLSAVDDISGDRLTNSTVPQELVRVLAAPIRVGKYVPIGTGSLVLPGSTIGEGAAVGAMSLVAGHLPDWMICAGNPAAPLRPRSRNLVNQDPVRSQP